MRCPKCNSRIDNTLDICNYCGERVKENSRNDQYEYSKAYSNIKKEYDDPHENQYDYSKIYSGSSKEYDTPHGQQHDYSKTYSGSSKEYDTPHDQQYDYSKTYSGSTKEYDTPHENQYTYSEQYSNNNSTIISSDEDYIKAYLGDNYKAIKNIKISFGAMFFGPIYLLYRKLWPQFILVIIAIIILTILYKDAIMAIIMINIVLAYISNKSLIKKANKEVEKTKNNNPDKDSRELLELCRKKGMPLSITLIVIFSMLTYMIAALIVSAFLYQ